MCPWPATLSLGADLEPAAVDFDDRQGRPSFDSRLKLMGQEAIDLLVAVVLKLLAGLVGDAVDLSAADGQLGQVGQGFGGVAE